MRDHCNLQFSFGGDQVFFLSLIPSYQVSLLLFALYFYKNATGRSIRCYWKCCLRSSKSKYMRSSQSIYVLENRIDFCADQNQSISWSGGWLICVDRTWEKTEYRRELVERRTSELVRKYRTHSRTSKEKKPNTRQKANQNSCWRIWGKKKARTSVRNFR